MHDTKYVIIPTNEITDEMRNSSDIEVPNTDRTGTIFKFRSCNKPSCFDGYANYTPGQLQVICQVDEPDNWGYSNPF